MYLKGIEITGKPDEEDTPGLGIFQPMRIDPPTEITVEVKLRRETGESFRLPTSLDGLISLLESVKTEQPLQPHRDPRVVISMKLDIPDTPTYRQVVAPGDTVNHTVVAMMLDSHGHLVPVSLPVEIRADVIA